MSSSRVYKSQHLTPKSPVVWKYDPITIPIGNQANQGNLDEQSEAKEQEWEQLPKEKIDEILTETREQAEQEAKEILEKAEQERDNMMEQAKSQGYKQGYQEGYQEGKNQAMKEIETQREELLSEAAHILQASKSDYRKLLENAEPQVCQLITDIADKLISDKLEQDSELITELVKNGLQKLANQDKVIIRAHPDDYGHLETNREQLLAEFDDIRIELVRDEELNTGSPILFGENGHIDLNIKRQLKEIRRAIGQVINNGSE